ncbi:hypothetical protein D3C74_422060 [compost metagenome]
MGARGSQDTNIKGETPIRTEDDDNTGAAHSRTGVYLAADGKDYRKPTRRTRSIGELITVDEGAKIRNKVRAAQYKRDTAPGRKVAYDLAEEPLRPEFVGCAGIGAKWKALVGREEIVEEAEITKKSVA